MPPTTRTITRAGYSVLKTECTTPDLEKIRHDLIVKPATPGGKTFAGKEVPTFPVFVETATEFIVPKYWGEATWGPGECALQTGIPMQTGLKFAGELREKQIDIVGAFIKEGSNGMICVPCGVGKTFMAIYIAYKLGLKTAVVVHKHFLLDQWRGEIERFLPGARIGYLYGDIIDNEDKDIVIVMLQSVTRPDKYPDHFFEDFGFVIWDECHHLGAEVFSRAMRILNAKNMLGLSATPKRADGLDKILDWYFGPFAIHAKRRDMIRVVRYQYESTDKKFRSEPMTAAREPNRPIIINNIAGFEPRNKYILECVRPFAELGRPTLILSERRDQLTYFHTAILAAGWKKMDAPVTVGFYVGGTKQEDLDAAAECDVILGTYAMASEGMNIKKLNTIVLATSKKDVEQTVGRIMRELVEARVTVHVCLDFLDQHACLQGQQNARLAFYKSNKYEILEMPMLAADRMNMEVILKPLPAIKTELEISIKRGKKRVVAPVPVPAPATKPFGKPLSYSQSIDPKYIDAPWLAPVYGRLEGHELINVPAGFVAAAAAADLDDLDDVGDSGGPMEKDATDDWGDDVPAVVAPTCPIEKDDDDWGATTTTTTAPAKKVEKIKKVGPRLAEDTLPITKGVVKVVPKSMDDDLPDTKVVKAVPRSAENALPVAKGIVKVVPRSAEDALPAAKGVVKVVPRSAEDALPAAKGVVKVVPRDPEVIILKRRK